MSKITIRQAKPALRVLLLGAALGALSACQSEPTNAVETPTASRSTKIVERDVEAPHIYQVSEQALWDGRPSLGGVWVASPDTRDPERVIMRNPANGKFVIGALFKRERDNPGPKLQISSDAAESLGVLAGQPVQISVTALRREEAAVEAPRTPSLDTNEDLVAPTTASAAEAKPVTTAKGPLAPVAPAAVAPSAPNAPEVKAASASSFKSKPSPAAAATAAAAPVTTQSLTTATSAVLDKAEAKAAPATASGAKPTATPTAKPNAQTATPAATPAQKPAKPAAKGRAIQVGIFSVEANADRARAQLAKAGIEAQVRKGSAGGKSYWSVSAQGDASALKQIRSAGFADAYLLK